VIGDGAVRHALPSVTLEKLGGGGWTTSSLRGRRAVLFCFASWCTCKDQLPGWQRYWTARGRDFELTAVAQEALGPGRLADMVSGMGLEFPIVVDRDSRLARELGFRIVPAGALVEEDGSLAYASDEDFDIADPRLRANIEAFLAGDPITAPASPGQADPGALALFAEGVRSYDERAPEPAIALWRRALALDPDNFLIRSQIWAAEHPERFWPAVDRDWQELQLVAEGYDKPLP
jgi:hypothetical protein